MEEQTIIETTAEEIGTETAEPQASDSTAIVLDTQTDEKDGLDLKSTLVGGIVVAAAGGLALGVKAIVTKVKKAKKDKADFEAWKANQNNSEEAYVPYEMNKEQQEEKEEPKQEQETSKDEEKSDNKKDEKKK